MHSSIPALLPARCQAAAEGTPAPLLQVLRSLPGHLIPLRSCVCGEEWLVLARQCCALLPAPGRAAAAPAAALRDAKLSHRKPLSRSGTVTTSDFPHFQLGGNGNRPFRSAAWEVVIHGWFSKQPQNNQVVKIIFLTLILALQLMGRTEVLSSI